MAAKTTTRDLRNHFPLMGPLAVCAPFMLLGGCVLQRTQAPAAPPAATTPVTTPAAAPATTPTPVAPAAAPVAKAAATATPPAATARAAAPPASAAPSRKPTAPPMPVAKSVAPAAAPAPTTVASLDLASLEQRLRDTHAIGVFTKLSLKNQVDDLLAQFRLFHHGQTPPTLVQLRQQFELLLIKVVSVLQDGDAALAAAVSSSRETLWSVLSDPQKFAQI